MAVSAHEDVDSEFEALLEHLRSARSADFTGYKRASLTRLVDRRMRAVGVEGYAAYQDLLEVDPAEFDQLFDALLINVTSLFRDGDAWLALRDTVVPTLLAELPPDQPLRVWCAACATGEEAYSLAILLCEVMGELAFRDRVKIYATDIDLGALAVARAARYKRSAVEGLPAEVAARYFSGEGDLLTFRPDLRSSIIFGRHDLIQDAPISRVHLLTCRNALMYFNHDTQTRVLERFCFAMQPSGVLMLGRAEMLLTHAELFQPLDLGNRLFARADHPQRSRVASALTGPGRPDTVLRQAARAAFLGALDAQLVLDADGRVLLVNDSAARALDVSAQDVGRPFRDLRLSYQPVDLAGAIAAVQGGGGAEVLQDVASRRGDEQVWYDVQLLPLVEDGAGVAAVLGVQLTFVDVTRHHRLTAELGEARRLLDTSNEELQSSGEELETTNEELQSAVEELETTNEELQSTNEELETMNEELQSTNEELQTLNGELRERTSEVNQVNAFLESILMGLRGGVVVVDRDLVVRVWNDRAEDMWGLRSHEAQGRHFLNLDVGLPVGDLRDVLRSVVNGGQDSLEVVLPAVNRFGKEVQTTVTCGPLRTPDGTVTGAIVVMEETPSASA